MHHDDYNAHFSMKQGPTRLTPPPRVTHRSSILLGLIILLTLGAALALGVKDLTLKHEASMYCHMVHLHRTQPDADVGWPDYNHVYEQQCNPDGTLQKDWDQ